MSDYRDDKGRFLAGVSKDIGGRPAGAGQQLIKDLCWESINKVAMLIFKLPKDQMLAWVEIHKDEMSLAEQKYIEAAKGDYGLNIIESLLDRIIGKQLKIDSGNTEKNPVIERLYALSPGGVRREIDQLIRNRNMIHEERGTDTVHEGERVDRPRKD